MAVTAELAREHLERRFPPKLFRFNGFGFTLNGWLHDVGLAPYSYRMVWFTLLYLPVWPVGIYLAEPLGGGRWQFLGRMPAGPFFRIYGWKGLGLVFGSLFELAFVIVFVFSVYALYRSHLYR